MGNKYCSAGSLARTSASRDSCAGTDLNRKRVSKVLKERPARDTCSGGRGQADGFRVCCRVFYQERLFGKSLVTR